MNIHLRFVIKITFDSVNKLLALINGEKKINIGWKHIYCASLPKKKKYPNAFPEENWQSLIPSLICRDINK